MKIEASGSICIRNMLDCQTGALSALAIMVMALPMLFWIAEEDSTFKTIGFTASALGWMALISGIICIAMFDLPPRNDVDPLVITRLDSLMPAMILLTAGVAMMSTRLTLTIEVVDAMPMIIVGFGAAIFWLTLIVMLVSATGRIVSCVALYRKGGLGSYRARTMSLFYRTN
jgi:hypothetical protein